MIVIYDPLTTRANPNGTGFIRDPFPGNIIPADRLNPIALAMLTQMPLPTSGRSFNGSAILDDGPQDQETLKIDHRWSDKWTTTGMYGHQHTKEPGSAFWGPHGTIPADPERDDAVPHGPLLLDQPDHHAEQHDGDRRPLRLQLLPGRRHQLRRRLRRRHAGLSRVLYQRADGRRLPEHDHHRLQQHRPRRPEHHDLRRPDRQRHACRSSWAAHSFKIGVDYRRIEAGTVPRTTATSASPRRITQGPNPNTASSVAGDAFASFLLGYPATGDVNVATPGAYYTDYYSAFVQDDFRVSSKLTLNFGLRYEYEPGIAADGNEFTVGFDRDALFPVQVPGMDLRGGLMYAGVDGYPTRQGKPLNNVAPRGGFA